jgi:hypothetical protein
MTNPAAQAQGKHYLQIKYLRAFRVVCPITNVHNEAMSETVTQLWEWPAAVIMERTALAGNRWASEKWEAKGIVRDVAAAAAVREIVRNEQLMQLLFPGLKIRLHKDEAEGYFYNLSSPQPKVFVLWRMEDDIAKPQFVTVSYHEGSRWLDSGENVDGVPLPPELAPWMAEFVELHYRPEPKKSRKYASNKDKGRMGNYGDA